jgi:hypothetical protein
LAIPKTGIPTQARRRQHHPEHTDLGLVPGDEVLDGLEADVRSEQEELQGDQLLRPPLGSLRSDETVRSVGSAVSLIRSNRSGRSTSSTFVGEIGYSRTAAASIASFFVAYSLT